MGLFVVDRTRQVRSFLVTTIVFLAMLPAPMTVALAAPPSVSFSAPQTFTPRGGGPRFVGVADFNSDGISDLAVANEGSGTISILIGNGSGVFTLTAGSPIAVGALPDSVAVGDFNNDGKVDLAADASTSVAILIGDGTGGFAAAPSPSLSLVNPSFVAAADFNNDQNLDLVVADASSNDVVILIGNGTGSFSPLGAPIATGRWPIAIATADFNLDGWTDFAVAEFRDNHVTVLLGNGSGGFITAPGLPITTDEQTSSITAVDVNGDGVPDLVVSASLGGSISILLGQRNGAFTKAAGSPIVVGTSSNWVTVADFNLDGKPDLAVVFEVSNNLIVLLGNGDGTFVAAPGFPVIVGTSPAFVTAGDFNRDGKSDLVTANFGFNNNLSVLLNTTAFIGTPAPTLTGLSPFRIEAGSNAFNLTVYGTNIQNGATAFWNNSPRATAFVSPTQLAVTITQADIASPGTANVSVVNPDGQGAATNMTFTISVPSPRVQSATPNHGPATGGTNVTITGTSFQQGATVTFNGVSASGVIVVSATQINAVTPAYSSGVQTTSINIVVKNPDNRSGMLAGGYTYVLRPGTEQSGAQPNADPGGSRAAPGDPGSAPAPMPTQR